MGWLGTIGGAVLGGPIGALAGNLLIDQPDDARDRADANQQSQKDLIDKSTQDQYNYVNQMQGPTLTDATQRRLKALDDQSQPGELSQDPYFQASRAQLVQGGQQALSGVQNRQAAYGTAGGFANQGSVNDVYDRLGSQMAQLGQQSVALKDQKANQAAQLRQQFNDAQTAFSNAQTQARMAIADGNTQKALAAMQAAYAAKEAITQAQLKMVGTGIQAAGTIAGGMLGGPPGAAAGAAAGGGIGDAATTAASDPYAATTGEQYAASASLPWAYQRAGAGGY